MYDNTELQIKKLTLGPYEANCYIVVCAQTSESVIIDIPAEAFRILAEAGKTSVKYILITHAHGDHIDALKEVRSQIKAPVAAHPLDARIIGPDLSVQDGDILKFGRQVLKVLHTPGHTAGSICLLAGNHLFSGDTIFPGGPGRTSTPQTFASIVESIKEKILVLSDDTMVYPGHGPDTILGREKYEFYRFSSHSHAHDLCGDVLWLSA
ncbi:MBL fold metallo-hydrolase [Chloroflexota bacterium]